MVASNIYAAPRSGSATSRTTSPAACLRPAASDHCYTANCEEPVWAYSGKRFARDNMTLNAQEARARAVVDGDKAARTPRFVKTTAGARALDESALARARRVAGLKGYVTNIPATTMNPDQVIASYHDLWHVEQSFRMSKTDLQARPFFARTRDAIEAHLTIVFTALAISRTIQDRTGLSIRKVLRELRPLRSATVDINGIVPDSHR